MGASAEGPVTSPRRVLLYTSGPDCSLCQRTELDLELLGAEYDFELCVVDLRGVPEAAEAFGARVPVVFLGEHLIAEGRIELGELRRALRAAAGRLEAPEPHWLGPERPPSGRGPQGVDSRPRPCEADEMS